LPDSNKILESTLTEEQKAKLKRIQKDHPEVRHVPIGIGQKKFW
jgi:hypothetical protein